MESSTSDKLQSMLSKLQEGMLQRMLQDLDDPDKRGPQLYNAIIKELQRNGIDCLPKAGDQGQNALYRLLEASRNASMDDAAMYTPRGS